jgi:LmbE family N-acetylglucosaminyl deacetylase
VDVTADIAQGAALVIAPHPDDETFGCGATIMRKRDRRVPVKIIIATDGAGSHGGDLANRQRVARRREVEARLACARLGVAEEDVLSLGFSDGGLEVEVEPLASRLHDLIGSFRPRHIFVPVSCDGHADHNAANRALQLALAGGDGYAEALEYPISLWAHWPWTRRQDGGPAVLRRALVEPVARVREVRPLLVAIDGYRQRKAEAIAEYSSQVESRESDAPPGLSARFVASFLGRYELFLPFGSLHHLGGREL